jgi:uncharacterized protein YijF (DUF1287 family)
MARHQNASGSAGPLTTSLASATTRIKAPNPLAAKVVAGAREQVGTAYDPAYVRLAYPDGDVPRDRGVCSDVVVRALRRTNHDLQRLIHEDMKNHFALYPKNWGLKRPDPNIDHRRVPNQMRFFERHGLILTKKASPSTARQWQPGDVVCWRLPNNLYHTGIVSDRIGNQGLPFVIHNLSTCVEADCLRNWTIIGHYRYPVATH